MHTMFYGGLLRLAIASQSVEEWEECSLLPPKAKVKLNKFTPCPKCDWLCFCPDGPVVYEPEAARRFFTLNATSLDKFLAIQQTDGK